ncbi:MerR family transcriptional regulator [Chloroflexota bacterium]
MKIVLNQPVYPIGVASELLEVHPETIRTWERAGVIQPPRRRGGKRFYSDIDLKRLEFIRRLIGEGLTLLAIRYYLRLYSCWEIQDCMGFMYRSTQRSFAKLYWRECTAYCIAPSDGDLCTRCRVQHREEWDKELSIH